MLAKNNDEAKKLTQILEYFEEMQKIHLNDKPKDNSASSLETVETINKNYEDLVRITQEQIWNLIEE